MLYGSYEMVRPETAMGADTLQKAFLRSRANSIEGGTTEVMKNILGERVLGEHRTPTIFGAGTIERGGQWDKGKSCDTFAPFGEAIVTTDEIPDPHKLGIKLWVNGVLKQDSHTSQMIFNLAEQIAHLSSRLTLYPGDLILTGTPAGVGAGRGEFLKAGDTVKLWIERIGELTSKMA